MNIVNADAKIISEIPAYRFDGTRVLIAEDSSINRRLGRLLLEMLGCAVTEVASGHQAVEAFRQFDFDVILMNCQMPGLDGFAATEAIRHIEHARGSRFRIPILAITAFALPSDRDYCLRAGMDDCLIKPLRKPMLSEALSRWLNVQSLSA